MEKRANFVGVNAGNHRNSGRPKALPAAARGCSGIVCGVDNTANAGGDESLRAGACPTGVIARLEGDNRGEANRGEACGSGHLAECINFGVWCSRPVVPTFGHYRSGVVDEHAANLRVSAGNRAVVGKHESATHRHEFGV